MAGDWIKMRSGLYSDPKVLAIAKHLMANSQFRNWAFCGDRDSSLSDVTLRYCVTGALHNAWCNANEHSRNGVVEHASIEWIDSVTEVPGFGEAMQKVGWVQVTPQGLNFPNFNRHNTSGAERQKKYRDKKRDESDVTRDVTRDVTLRPREEKRREEKNRSEKIREDESPSGDSNTHHQAAADAARVSDSFDLFWKAFPRKAGKIAARKAWKSALKVADAETITEAALAFAESDVGKAGSFCPHPATWLNEGRWMDDRETWKRDVEKPLPTFGSSLSWIDEAVAE